MNYQTATALGRITDQRAQQPSHADGRAVLARAQGNGSFLKDTDVALIAADERTRLTLLLVRCGACRFLAAAQDVAHIIESIEKNDDYVRDVSIPSNSTPA